jgi:hypothetical protein
MMWLMPKRFSKQPGEKLNRSLVSRVMAEMGRKGGRIGGKRKLTTLTAERRQEIARKAANVRWHRNET